MKPVTGKAFAHALERKGWRLCHTRGSHHYYAKPGVAALVCVPIHVGRTLKAGTQSALMKLSGLTDVDL